VDVSYKVMKDTAYRDNPPNPEWKPGMNPFERLLQKYSEDMPDNHEFNRWLRGVADEYSDRVLVGEIYLSIPQLVTHYGNNDEFHLPFNFHLILATWKPLVILSLIEEYEQALPEGAWPNWVLGNHDQHRFASRAGVEQARIGMMLLLTLRGTPTMYQGDELGMVDGEIPPDKVQDPAEINAPGLGLGRDPERTPIQWDDSPNAGFCPPEVEPWLPVAANYETVNAAAQKTQPHSMLLFTRQLIALRQQTEALYGGSYRTLGADETLLAYVRETTAERYVVVLNFGAEDRPWTLPDEGLAGEVVLSTVMDGGMAVQDGVVVVRGREGIILR
jgi:alpha-glucosidase